MERGLKRKCQGMLDDQLFGLAWDLNTGHVLGNQDNFLWWIGVQVQVEAGWERGRELRVRRGSGHTAADALSGLEPGRGPCF